jgi:hypothetical protein
LEDKKTGKRPGGLLNAKAVWDLGTGRLYEALWVSRFHPLTSSATPLLPQSMGIDPLRAKIRYPIPQPSNAVLPQTIQHHKQLLVQSFRTKLIETLRHYREIMGDMTE